jgi:hypothetical protein
VGGQRHAPAALLPGKRHGSRCTGGWIDLGASLEDPGKFRLLQDLNPGPSSTSESVVVVVVVVAAAAGFRGTSESIAVYASVFKA